MNYQFYTHFESGKYGEQTLYLMVLQIFALKKVLYQNYHIFFYSIDACGNGYLRNIVTTSLFMTLVEWLLKKSTGGQGPDVSPPLKIKKAVN